MSLLQEILTHDVANVSILLFNYLNFLIKEKYLNTNNYYKIIFISR